MSAAAPAELLRPGLLEGVRVLVAGVEPPEATASAGAAALEVCRSLGAQAFECALGQELLSALERGERDELERIVRRASEDALAQGGGVDLLVVDSASVFARAGREEAAPRARRALRTCLDVSWELTRTVATAAFLERERGGRIVYIAPEAAAGEHADAARAGLENLARTLSVEWARHAITTVAIAPGAEAGATGEAAALAAYLASPAGAYFSGCLLDLRGPGGR